MRIIVQKALSRKLSRKNSRGSSPRLLVFLVPIDGVVGNILPGGQLLQGFTHGGIFRRWRNEFTLADTEVWHPIPVEFATGCFLLIRTDIFKHLNGFDPRFFLYQEDSDLSRRVLEENLGSIVYHPDMRITHQWARENTRTFKGRMRQIRSVWKYFWKWGVTW